MTSGSDPKAGDGTRADESSVRRWAIWLGVIVAVFLLGFVPMWIQNTRLGNEISQKDREIRRSEIRGSLASAAIGSRRGDYEPARQSASAFYSEVSAELDKGETSVFNASERTQINGLLTGRDEVITLLSRGDPASAERLSDLYVGYLAATQGK
ncbi:MAG: hypothetical protein AB7V18_16925 [Pyrinomonadaceae bacterium]